MFGPPPQSAAVGSHVLPDENPGAPSVVQLALHLSCSAVEGGVAASVCQREWRQASAREALEKLLRGLIVVLHDTGGVPAPACYRCIVPPPGLPRPRLEDSNKLRKKTRWSTQLRAAAILDWQAGAETQSVCRRAHPKPARGARESGNGVGGGVHWSEQVLRISQTKCVITTRRQLVHLDSPFQVSNTEGQLPGRSALTKECSSFNTFSALVPGSKAPGM